MSDRALLKIGRVVLIGSDIIPASPRHMHTHTHTRAFLLFSVCAQTFQTNGPH